MIRKYSPDDLPQLVGLLQSTELMTADEIGKELARYEVFVYDDGMIRGLAGYRKENERQTKVRILVAPAFRRRGIGKQLWDEIEPVIQGLHTPSVINRYRGDEGDGRSFYATRGFKPWYALETMRYSGPAFPEAGLAVVPFEERYIESLAHIVGDAFEPIRRFYDFKPHNVADEELTPENQAETLGHRNNIFLILDGGEPAAVGVITATEVDLVAVAPAHQGKGYGRKLTQFCTNELMRRGMSEPLIQVLERNEVPKRLYAGLGYTLVRIDEFAVRHMETGSDLSSETEQSGSAGRG